MAKVLRLMFFASGVMLWENYHCFAARVINVATGGDINSGTIAINGERAYVGGANFIIQVQFSSSSNATVKRVDFLPVAETLKVCMQFSDASDCDNTVKILKFTSGGSVLVCGTNAKYAKCYSKRLQNDTFLEVDLDARKWMPESAKSKVVSVFSNSSEFYVASVPSSTTGGLLYKKKNDHLKSEKSWFEEPEFIEMHDVPSKNYIYLFFNEKSSIFVQDKFDATNQNKDYYSMVARVCKNDRGGSWNKGTWMTFSKVRLICPWRSTSLEKSDSLLYNELISTFGDGESVFGLFRTNRNWNLSLYALAEFDTNAIDDVIEGRVFPENKTRYFDANKPNMEVWFEASSGNPPFAPGQCPNESSYKLKSEFERFVLENTLVKANIEPVAGAPFFIGRSEQHFKFIFVQNFSWCKVIILLTELGALKTILLLPDRKVVELREQKAWQDSDIIQEASLAEGQNVILASTATKVVLLTFVNCSVHINCHSCNADPHCLWTANSTGLDFNCQFAAEKRQRTCSAKPQALSNLSANVTGNEVVIFWSGTRSPLGVFTVITLRVQATQEVIVRNKTYGNTFAVPRSNLRDGCVYEITASVVNGTTLSDETTATFFTDLEKPRLALLEKQDSFALKWDPIPDASKYLVKVSDHGEETIQEVEILSSSKRLYFYFWHNENMNIKSVSVMAMSDDAITSIQTKTIAPFKIIETVAEVDNSEKCMNITSVLVVFVALFVISLIILIHNTWTIKPRVSELKSDEDGCYYRRQYLFIWTRKRQATHVKCDDAVTSSTNA